MVTKNCEPLVFGPALAHDSRPGPLCFSLKLHDGRAREETSQHDGGQRCQLNGGRSRAISSWRGVRVKSTSHQRTFRLKTKGEEEHA